MKLHGSESVAHNDLQTFVHETMAFMTSEGVVTQIGTAEGPKNGIRKIDHPGDLIVISPAQQKSRVCWLRHVVDIRSKLRGR